MYYGQRKARLGKQPSRAQKINGSKTYRTGILVAQTDLDFKAIAEAAKQRAMSIVTSLLPGGKFVGEGRREYCARNPKRGDRTLGSFKVNVRTGEWADFSPDAGPEARGGDLISLWAYLNDQKQLDAARDLARFLGQCAE